MSNFKLLKGYTDNSRVVHIDINHLPERYLNPVSEVTMDIRLPENIN